MTIHLFKGRTLLQKGTPVCQITISGNQPIEGIAIEKWDPTVAGAYCESCINVVSGLANPENNAALIRAIAAKLPEPTRQILVFAAAINERYIAGVCPKCAGGALCNCLRPRECVHPRRPGMSCGPEMKDHHWDIELADGHECSYCHAVMPNPFGPIPEAMRSKT